jgi:hypothetical protein
MDPFTYGATLVMYAAATLVLMVLLPMSISVHMESRRERIVMEAYNAYQDACEALYEWKLDNPYDSEHHPDAQQLLAEIVIRLQLYLTITSSLQTDGEMDNLLERIQG